MPARMLAFSLWIFILSMMFGLFWSIKPVLAQTQQSTQPNTITVAHPNYSPQSPQYLNIIFINLVHTISCFAEGRSIIYQPCIGLVTVEDENKQLSSLPVEIAYDPSGGLLGTSGDLLTIAFTTPPVRTAEYLADLRENLGIKTAHAQVAGSGAGVIEPIKKIWELSRNIAYLGMTVIFVIIGLMIMFRRKLNPQTVISIQSAIPGLVISLVLITFSYFIVSVVVDVGFVSSHVVAGVFQSAGIIQDSNKLLEADNGILGMFTNFIAGDEAISVANETAQTLSFLKQGLPGVIMRIISSYVGCKLGTVFGEEVLNLAVGANTAAAITAAPATGGLSLLEAAGGLFFGWVGKPLASLAGCAAGGIGGLVAFETGLIFWLAGLFLYLILIIALLVAMFRVLWAIITCYISIITLTILGPIKLLFAAIPGSKSGAGSWIKDLLGNVLVFPALYAVFFVAAFILGHNNSIANNFGLNSSLTPSKQAFENGAIPFLNGLSTVFLRVVLGYGILLLSPNIPDMVKGYLGVKDPGYAKMAIGAVTSGFGIGKTYYDKAFEQRRKESQAMNEARLKAEASKWADNRAKKGSNVFGRLVGDFRTRPSKAGPPVPEPDYSEN